MSVNPRWRGKRVFGGVKFIITKVGVCINMMVARGVGHEFSLIWLMIFSTLRARALGGDRFGSVDSGVFCKFAQDSPVK